MTPHDTLHDRLADVAAALATPVPEGTQVRRSAVRHRTQRRVVAGTMVTLAMAGIAVAASTMTGPRDASLAPPATPFPSVTSAPTEPSPEPSMSATRSENTTPTETESVGAPPLTREEAQRVVADLRFPVEEEWIPDEVTPVTEIDEPIWAALGCPDVPFGGDALAARTLHHSEVDWESLRQVVVYEDAAQAADAFADLRSHMRTCHAQPVVEDVGGETWTTTMVGGQLELGDESFWVGEDMRVTASDGDAPPDRVGQEQIYTHANLLALDDNVIVSIWSPAYRADGRTRFVQEASEEFEAFQPRYEEVRRP